MPEQARGESIASSSVAASVANPIRIGGWGEKILACIPKIKGVVVRLHSLVVWSRVVLYVSQIKNRVPTACVRAYGNRRHPVDAGSKRNCLCFWQATKCRVLRKAVKASSSGCISGRNSPLPDQGTRVSSRYAAGNAPLDFGWVEETAARQVIREKAGNRPNLTGRNEKGNIHSRR